MKVVSFNYVADLHIDFILDYVKNAPYAKDFTIVDLVNIFMENTKEKSDNLIIAGDISNSRTISAHFMVEICKRYNQVFFVFGNHDYYDTCENKNPIYDFWINLDIPNLKILRWEDGVYNFEGVRIIGDMGGYDFREAEALDYYLDEMNDSVCNKELSTKDLWNDWKNMKRLHDEELFHLCITHIPPVTVFPELWASDYCYTLNYDLKNNVTYIFGHTHENFIKKIEEKNTTLATCTFGYPNKIARVMYELIFEYVKINYIEIEVITFE